MSKTSIFILVFLVLALMPLTSAFGFNNPTLLGKSEITSEINNYYNNTYENVTNEYYNVTQNITNNITNNNTYQADLTNVAYTNESYSDYWYNHTSSVFNLWGQWFYNMTTPFTNWLSTFAYNYNQTIPANSYTDNQISSIDYSTKNVNRSSFWDNLDSPLTTWTATYNSTYDAIVPFGYNHTLATYNLWNTIWSSTFNSSYVTMESDPVFTNQNSTMWIGINNKYNASYMTNTYNATYNTWAYNQTYSGSTYNATYAGYSFGAINETLATYNLWNTIWSAVYNSSYLTSILPNSTTLHLSNITGTTSYQATAGQYLTNVSFVNGVLSGVNSTVSATVNPNSTTLAWTNITSHPSACSAGTWATDLPDTNGAQLTCSAVPIYNSSYLTSILPNSTTLHLSNITGTTSADDCTAGNLVSDVTMTNGVITTTCTTDQTGTSSSTSDFPPDNFRSMGWIRPVGLNAVTTFTVFGITTPVPIGTASGMINIPDRPNGALNSTTQFINYLSLAVQWASGGGIYGVNETTYGMMPRLITQVQTTDAGGTKNGGYPANRSIWIALEGSLGTAGLLIQNGVNNSGLGVPSYVGIRYCDHWNLTAVQHQRCNDTTWQCCSGNGTRGSCINMGVPVLTNYTYGIAMEVENFTTLRCRVNNITDDVTVYKTDLLPNDVSVRNQQLLYRNELTTTNAVAKNYRIAWMYLGRN